MKKVITNKLGRAFYLRPTLEVLEDIIGKIIVYESPMGTMSARISEARYVSAPNEEATSSVLSSEPESITAISSTTFIVAGDTTT